MIRIAGVTFRQIGKLHYYRVGTLPVEIGTRVIAETERGLEQGEVKILRDVAEVAPEEAGSADIPFLLRVATEEDLSLSETRQKKAQEGLAVCQRRADALHLPMKVVEAEVSFDGEQITLYFVAESRVDFRQLVKEVVAIVRMRVHLHQVGSRDHAKALGGYGPCGRPLCCTTFLRDFAPVTMKMAKDQSLYLNPSKFSGVCGKLMCCLRYEHDLYMEAKDRMPPLGVAVSCKDGSRGVVSEVDIFKETVVVTIRTEEETRMVRYPVSDVTVARACGDCGSAGGGCGGACGSSSCSTSAKVAAKPIVMEYRRKT